MYKLAIDAGHGMYTPGKRCLKSLDPAETREWWLNQRVAGYLQGILADYDGIEVRRVDDVTGKTDVPISGSATRQTAANKWGADFYLSIHHNAGIGGGSGGGITAFVYGVGGVVKVGADTVAWRDKIYDALLAAGGLRGNRAAPKTCQDLAVCRETAMPAVLVECGFMDSETDVPVILSDAYAQKMARGFAQAIVVRWGLRKKAAAVPTVPVPPPAAPTGLKAGALVIILTGAVYYDGKAVPAWVPKQRWRVKSIGGDRVVLGYNEAGDNAINSPFHAKYLRLVGDINGDGVADSADARLALQAEVGLITLSTDQRRAADVNGDGKVDSTDARLILQSDVGL